MKPEYLTKLGAARIIDGAELSEKALLWVPKNGLPLSTLWAVTRWQMPSPKHVMVVR